jgi:heat shock protein HtpX
MWEQIRANQRKSAILVVVMAFFLFAAGYAAAEAIAPGSGIFGLFIAFAVWTVLSLVSYYSGDSIILAVSGARKIKRDDLPRLYNVVEEMQIASGLPKMPDIYIIDDPAPNAFATGRDPNHAAVAVTSGLLNICNRDELQGVIGHEMAHIRNRDILFMIMVGVMMGTIVLIADLATRVFLYGGAGRQSRRSSNDSGQLQMILALLAVVLAILAPIIAQLIYFAVSRKREYLADACGAQFTRYPDGLASALEKIAASTAPLQHANRATAPMYIINPLRQKGMAASDLTSTHPPIKERIRILRSMAGGAGFTDYDKAFRQVTGKRSAIPQAEVSEAKPVPARRASEAVEEHADRARETTDALWKVNNYAFIACPCGVTLKIPPLFKLPTIQCPHCQRTHSVPQKTEATPKTPSLGRQVLQ